MRLLLNVLAISPSILWRDYVWTYSNRPVTRGEAFRQSFWFQASGAHRRIAGYVDLGE